MSKMSAHTHPNRVASIVSRPTSCADDGRALGLEWTLFLNDYGGNGFWHSHQKQSIFRSEPYRRFVASHACFWCGVSGLSQCAHDNYGKGMAMKVSDARTFPLCGPRFGLIGCHQTFDLCIGITRDERRAMGAQWVERMQGIAAEHGWKL